MIAEQDTHYDDLVIAAEWTEDERAEIAAELNRIVDDASFKRSTRCVSLLRHVVNGVLLGEQDRLKERILGAEVFGRSANYDPSADSVVRMAANEVRKRLAQYYQNAAEPHAVTFRLEAGSYSPIFEFHKNDAVDQTQAPVESSLPEPQSPASPKAAPAARTATCALLSFGLSKRTLLVLAAILVAAVAATAELEIVHSRKYALWGPLMGSKRSVIVCVSDDLAFARGGERYLTPQEKVEAVNRIVTSLTVPPSTAPHKVRGTPFADARVANEISAWLGLHGKATVLTPASSLTLEDLHHQTAVLVGAFDNPWTLIMLSKLRFSPGYTPSTGLPRITDAQDRESIRWTKLKAVASQPAADYAIVARFWSAETQNWVLVVAGLGESGTKAAAQLLLDPSLVASMPDVSASKSFEIVIKTEIINGNNSRPQIVAVHTW